MLDEMMYKRMGSCTTFSKNIKPKKETDRGTYLKATYLNKKHVHYLKARKIKFRKGISIAHVEQLFCLDTLIYGLMYQELTKRIRKLLYLEQFISAVFFFWSAEY